MDKKDLSIATMTWARNEEEETVLRQALQQLAKLDIPVFITDGGSGASFLQFLDSFPHFLVLNPCKGVWMQAKNSLFNAYDAGTKFIFYTEPDKADFFAHTLSHMLHEITVNEQTGVVTASRSANGFATFPAFQQMTETAINYCCAEVIKRTGDYTYGPFLLNRQLVPYLHLVQEDIGWGWRPYVFGIAARLGYKVNIFEADSFCPPGQEEDSAAERIYRMRQLSQNIQGIVLSTSIQLPGKDDLNLLVGKAT